MTPKFYPKLQVGKGKMPLTYICNQEIEEEGICSKVIAPEAVNTDI